MTPLQQVEAVEKFMLENYRSNSISWYATDGSVRVGLFGNEHGRSVVILGNTGAFTVYAELVCVSS